LDQSGTFKTLSDSACKASGKAGAGKYQKHISVDMGEGTGTDTQTM